MQTAVIIERIRTAVQQGTLTEFPEARLQVAALKISDLLRPWTEVYPCCDPELAREPRDVFCWSGLRKPDFVPVPRRSLRRLPVPRPVPVPLRLVGPGLFASVKGIWDYYQATGVAAPALISGELSSDSLQRFNQPLWDALSDYWPLCGPLGMFPENDPHAIGLGICLTLPHYVYDAEESGVVEAFLSDLDSVESLLDHFVSREDFLELSPRDRKLIKDVGMGAMLEVYADYPGKKICDLRKLANWSETYFGDVLKKYPTQMITDWPIISGNGGVDADIYIESMEDIEFALAYWRAWDNMMGAFPAEPYMFETNDGGVVDRLIQEICRVWRKQKGQHPKKPAGKTLKEVL